MDWNWFIWRQAISSDHEYPDPKFDLGKTGKARCASTAWAQEFALHLHRGPAVRGLSCHTPRVRCCERFSFFSYCSRIKRAPLPAQFLCLTLLAGVGFLSPLRKNRASHRRLALVHRGYSSFAPSEGAPGRWPQVAVLAPGPATPDLLPVLRPSSHGQYFLPQIRDGRLEGSSRGRRSALGSSARAARPTARPEGEQRQVPGRRGAAAALGSPGCASAAARWAPQPLARRRPLVTVAPWGAGACPRRGGRGCGGAAVT